MSQLLPERRSRTSDQWEPLTQLELMTDRMRRMLDQTFGGFGLPSPSEAKGWSPLVDLEETEDSYVVEAELPGVRREDVNVELVGSELTISGEVEERERKGMVRRQTRRTGRFDFRITLPEHVEGEKVEARLADGVLTVRIPKSERAPRRKIEITS